MYYQYHEIKKNGISIENVLYIVLFFVITLTPYRHTKPKLNSNLAIAKICMVYGRLHELIAFQNWGSTIFWLHHFFKPLLSFVPKAIFIIYTPMLFLSPFVWEKFFNPSNPTDQISVFCFLFWLHLRFCHLLSGCWMIQVMEWCIWQNIQFRQKTQTRVHTAITDHLNHMFMLDRWWLHVDGCSMYIWSNCSCRLLHVSVRFFIIF